MFERISGGSLSTAVRELNKTGEPWNAGKKKKKKEEREKERHGGIWSVQKCVRINKRMLIIFGIEYLSFFFFVIITPLANNIEEL